MPEITFVDKNMQKLEQKSGFWHMMTNALSKKSPKAYPEKFYLRKTYKHDLFPFLGSFTPIQ